MKKFLFLLLFTTIAYINRTEGHDPSKEEVRKERNETMEHRYTPPQETQETQEEEDFIPATYNEPTFISTDYDLAQMPALQRSTTECIYPTGTYTRPRTRTPSDDFGWENDKYVRDPRRRKNKKYGKEQNQREDKHSKKSKKSKKTKTKTRTRREYYSKDADWSSEEDYRSKLAKLRQSIKLSFLYPQMEADLSSSDSDVTWGTDEITVLDPFDNVESIPLRSIEEDENRNRIPYHRRLHLSNNELSSSLSSSETEVVAISRPQSRNRSSSGRASPFISQRPSRPPSQDQIGAYTNLGSTIRNVTELNTIANSQSVIRSNTSSRCNTPFSLNTSNTPNPLMTSSTSSPLNTSSTLTSNSQNQLNTSTPPNSVNPLASNYAQSNDPDPVDLHDGISSYTGVDVDDPFINIQDGDTNSKDESLTATTTKDTDNEISNTLANGPAIDIETVENGDVANEDAHNDHDVTSITGDDDAENSSDSEAMKHMPCDTMSKCTYKQACSSIPLENQSTSVPVLSIPSRNQPLRTLTITNNTEIDDDEVTEQMKTLMSQLKTDLLIMAAVTFSSIILYSVYYINLIRKIYSKNRISK